MHFRNSANAVFPVDNVFARMAATLRPKFRQRRRLLVPAYTSVRNAAYVSCNPGIHLNLLIINRRNVDVPTTTRGKPDGSEKVPGGHEWA